jgi:hypothetical protein
MLGEKSPAGVLNPDAAGRRRRDLRAALPANGAERDPVAKLVQRLRRAAASGEPMSLGRRARIGVATVPADACTLVAESGS